MLELFEYKYPKNKSKKETTEIEYVQFDFSADEKKRVIILLNKYCEKHFIDNMSDGLLDLLEKNHEKEKNE